MKTTAKDLESWVEQNERWKWKASQLEHPTAQISDGQFDAILDDLEALQRHEKQELLFSGDTKRLGELIERMRMIDLCPAIGGMGRKLTNLSIELAEAMVRADAARLGLEPIAGESGQDGK